jgi:hypothetical protein
MEIDKKVEAGFQYNFLISRAGPSQVEGSPRANLVFASSRDLRPHNM